MYTGAITICATLVACACSTVYLIKIHLSAFSYLHVLLTYSAWGNLCTSQEFMSAANQLPSWSVPGHEAAVVKQAVLHKHAPLLLSGHRVAIVPPSQLHRGVDVGGGALQGEPVALKHQLPLGGNELEQGHFQGSICGMGRG